MLDQYIHVLYKLQLSKDMIATKGLITSQILHNKISWYRLHILAMITICELKLKYHSYK